MCMAYFGIWPLPAVLKRWCVPIDGVSFSSGECPYKESSIWMSRREKWGCIHIMKGCRPPYTRFFSFPPLSRLFSMASETTAGARSSVLLVDDHALFRAGLSLIISTHPLVREVLEVENVMAAMRVEAQAVHLVLLDIVMPGINGLDGIAMMAKKFPDAAIAMVSASFESDEAKTARHLGASGFVPKTATAADIGLAVSALLRGHEWFPKNRDASSVPPPNTHTSSADERLTGRQMQVLGYLCGGLSNRAIALRMDISENTVRSHVHGVLRSFNAISRAEAVVSARLRGIVR